MKIEKILAGIDFQKDTESVLAYAAYFAKILQGKCDEKSYKRRNSKYSE